MKLLKDERYCIQVDDWEMRRFSISVRDRFDRCGFRRCGRCDQLKVTANKRYEKMVTQYDFDCESRGIKCPHLKQDPPMISMSNEDYQLTDNIDANIAATSDHALDAAAYVATEVTKIQRDKPQTEGELAGSW